MHISSSMNDVQESLSKQFIATDHICLSALWPNGSGHLSYRNMRLSSSIVKDIAYWASPRTTLDSYPVSECVTELSAAQQPTGRSGLWHEYCTRRVAVPMEFRQSRRRDVDMVTNGVV
jgi:hypothetical protein